MMTCHQIETAGDAQLAWRKEIAQKKLKMPNGDVLECDYPTDKNWARSWTSFGKSIDGDGVGVATGEQDWEIVERYGLTAILDAILFAAQSAAPAGPQVRNQSAGSDQP